MTEPIKWRDARKVKPKRVGMVRLSNSTGAPIAAYWDGYHFWKDGLAVRPTHWAPMPKGPKR
jgi:hypothetical protein